MNVSDQSPGPDRSQLRSFGLESITNVPQSNVDAARTIDASPTEITTVIAVPIITLNAARRDVLVPNMFAPSPWLQSLQPVPGA